MDRDLLYQVFARKDIAAIERATPETAKAVATVSQAAAEMPIHLFNTSTKTCMEMSLVFIRPDGMFAETLPHDASKARIASPKETP